MGGPEMAPQTPQRSERPGKSRVAPLNPPALRQRLAADPGGRDVARRIARGHVARAVRPGAARTRVAAARRRTATTAAAVTATAAFAPAPAFTAIAATTAPTPPTPPPPPPP